MCNLLSSTKTRTQYPLQSCAATWWTILNSVQPTPLDRVHMSSDVGRTGQIQRPITPNTVQPWTKVNKKRHHLGMSSTSQNDYIVQETYPVLCGSRTWRVLKMPHFCCFLMKAAPCMKNVKNNLWRNLLRQWFTWSWLVWWKSANGKWQNDASHKSQKNPYAIEQIFKQNNCKISFRLFKTKNNGFGPRCLALQFLIIYPLLTFALPSTVNSTELILESLWFPDEPYKSPLLLHSQYHHHHQFIISGV